MIRPSRLVLSVAVGTLLVSCAGGNNVASQLATPPPKENVIEKLGARCGVTKSQAKPLIVEWSSMARGELEAKAADGLVPVRYEGCEMEVLSQCRVKEGRYRYKPITLKRDSIEMRDADELYANVPVGAARLESKLEKYGALKVAMTIVGRYEAETTDVAPDQLVGRDCEKATHVVASLTTGAFQFFAEGRASVGAGARTVVGPGIDAESKASREEITKDGIEEACAQASASDTQPPAGCGALIQVEVVPLGKAKPLVPNCPEGSEWDGRQCVRKNVVTQVECPAGTKWDGSRCAAEVITSCPAGTHFEAGRGCVPDVVAVVPEAPATPTVAVTAPKSSTAPAASSGKCPDGMAFIPGATFKMGSNDGFASEKPVHKASVAAFCLDVTEVTAGAYAACVRSGRCSAAGLECHSTATTYGVRGKENHPINCVDWGQAATYCNTMGKRLPTEEEWEYAARGGSKGWTFPWGNAEPDFQLCWSGITKRYETCPVGSFPQNANPWGVLDLAGNVFEWTASVWSDDYSKKRNSETRVLRGGSWRSDQVSAVRGSVRYRLIPSYRDSDMGFRCAKSL